MMTTEDLFRQIKAHHVKSQLLCVTVPNPPQAFKKEKQYSEQAKLICAV